MSIDGDTFEPAAVAAELRDTVDQATGHLLRTAARLTDEQAREPSLLPGWSRGHVLTHIARNADGLRNLLIWARTGVVTPQYADEGERERGIVAGAGRSAADLLADLDGICRRLRRRGRPVAPRRLGRRGARAARSRAPGLVHAPAAAI